MSITLIAMAGILVGFLCLVIGFFMEDSNDHSVLHEPKRPRSLKKKMVVPKRKVA
jgi:hypothetical protein